MAHSPECLLKMKSEFSNSGTWYTLNFQNNTGTEVGGICSPQLLWLCFWTGGIPFACSEYQHNQRNSLSLLSTKSLILHHWTFHPANAFAGSQTPGNTKTLALSLQLQEPRWPSACAPAECRKKQKLSMRDSPFWFSCRHWRGESVWATTYDDFVNCDLWSRSDRW